MSNPTPHTPPAPTIDPAQAQKAQALLGPDWREKLPDLLRLVASLLEGGLGGLLQKKGGA